MWHKALQAMGALLLLQTSVKIPEPRGYINDFANVIPAADTLHIHAVIDDVRAKSGGEIVVVTLPDKPDAELTKFAEGWTNTYDPRAKKS